MINRKREKNKKRTLNRNLLLNEPSKKFYFLRGLLSKELLSKFFFMIFIILGIIISFSPYLTKQNIEIITNKLDIQLFNSQTGGIGTSDLGYNEKYRNLGSDYIDAMNPTLWTCTLRTASSSCEWCTVTVSCSGNEKVVAGGCAFNTGNAWYYPTSRPTNQGWHCYGYTGGGSVNMTTFASCCL